MASGYRDKKGVFKGKRDTPIHRQKYEKKQWLANVNDQFFSIFFRYGPVFLDTLEGIDQFFSIFLRLLTRKSLYESGY